LEKSLLFSYDAGEVDRWRILLHLWTKKVGFLYLVIKFNIFIDFYDIFVLHPDYVLWYIYGIIRKEMELMNMARGNGGLTAPSVRTLILALLIVVLGIVGRFIYIPYVTEYCFWLPVGGFGLLLLGTLFRGL
jgi:hypothetical protein